MSIVSVLFNNVDQIAGAALATSGTALHFARFKTGLRRWIECRLLDEGHELFDPNQPYAPTVKWLRYAAFPAGIALLAPMSLAVNIVVGVAGAGAFYWALRQREQLLRDRSEAAKVINQ